MYVAEGMISDTGTVMEWCKSLSTYRYIERGGLTEGMISDTGTMMEWCIDILVKGYDLRYHVLCSSHHEENIVFILSVLSFIMSQLSCGRHLIFVLAYTKMYMYNILSNLIETHGICLVHLSATYIQIHKMK